MVPGNRRLSTWNSVPERGDAVSGRAYTHLSRLFFASAPQRVIHDIFGQGGAPSFPQLPKTDQNLRRCPQTRMANAQSRCAPGGCAGARAERPVAGRQAFAPIQWVMRYGALAGEYHRHLQSRAILNSSCEISSACISCPRPMLNSHKPTSGGARPTELSSSRATLRERSNAVPTSVAGQP